MSPAPCAALEMEGELQCVAERVPMNRESATLTASIARTGKEVLLSYLLRRPITTTVLRCPLEVSFARRFLTSSNAFRWVENKPNRSSPTPTDQPPLMRWTTKVVVIACVATNEHSTNL
jgi:hypothetical protein